MSDNKYKGIWNDLKESVLKRIKEYEGGEMMSMSESVWGAAIYKEVLEKMNKLEEDF